MLLAFIVALAQDPDLQEAYLRDPVTVVMERDDLSVEERRILLSRDRRRIADRLAAEEFKPRLPAMLTAPMPLPWVYGRQTVTGFFWDTADDALTLTIYGTELRDAFNQCELRNGDTRIQGVVGEEENTPGGQKVTLRFELPPDTPPGVYWAYVDARVEAEESPAALASADMLNLHLGYEIGAEDGDDEEDQP